MEGYCIVKEWCTRNPSWSSFRPGKGDGIKENGWFGGTGCEGISLWGCCSDGCVGAFAM